MKPFTDRHDAGQRLARVLEHLRGTDMVVLGLPRGGVPVAAEVARHLDAPLDVLLVRKLGVPFQPEVAMGAIGEGGVRILNTEVLRAVGITQQQLADVDAEERRTLERRARRFRSDRAPIDLAGRTALIVDDGIATGSTAVAACHVARHRGAATIIVATPVASQSALEALHRVADDVICLAAPPNFRAVGEWYRDFGQTSDDEVVHLLGDDRDSDGTPATATQGVAVVAGTNRLPGRLVVPDGATGFVIFAHGSGSSHASPRNQWVAEVLNDAGLATLLFDLLTPREEVDRRNVFDIPFLASRLTDATRWAFTHPDLATLPLGYFGASTGAGAALWAAAEPSSRVEAVVSRGGRPDLAAPRLHSVTAPTLLIVGERDPEVLDLNRRAAALLGGVNELAVVPGATHVFPEPGTLAMAAQLARDWFLEHLAAEAGDAPRTVTRLSS